MFQLLLQFVTVVLEVPNIGFKIRLTLFLPRIFVIFHVYVKLQVRLYKAWHEPFL